MRQLPQQHSTTAQSAAAACRCARKHGSISCTLIGWPAVWENIKGEKDDSMLIIYAMLSDVSTHYLYL